jgi:fumarate hydratase, class II
MATNDKSAKSGTPVRNLCMERLKELGMVEAELTQALNPARMCTPVASMVEAGGG